MSSGLAPGGVAPPAYARAWSGSGPLARPADRALAAVGALCFKAFLAAQFLSLTRLFFSEHLGEGITAIASQVGVLSVALLLPAVVAYGLGSGSMFGTLVPQARLWVTLVLGLSLVLFVYGLVQEFAVNTVVHDLAPYLVILVSVVLGSVRRAWADSDRTILLLFAAAIVVNAVGMTEMATVVSEGDPEVRAARDVLAYRTQWALAFWPLLLLTARLRRPATALFILAGSFFVLAQQVLFQKRSPTVRIALFMLVLLVILPRLRRDGGGGGERRTAAMIVGVGTFTVVLALTLAPWLFRGQVAGLARRLSGEGYRGGPAAMLTWENERYFEAGMFLRTLRPQEVVFGRGFGGYFVPSTGGWGTFSDDVGEVVRRQVHVGALMPFFKGGLALTLVFYAGLVHALVRGRRFLREPLAAAAFFVILVHTVFFALEGWFIMSVSFDMVMVGLCMGHLLSRERGLGPARRLAWARTASRPDR